MCSRKICCGIFSCFGILFIGLGIGMIFGVRPLLNLALKSKLPLNSNSSQIWDAFVDPSSEDITITRKFTFFQVNNPNQVCIGAAPDVTAVGPYVYKQTKVKYSIQRPNSDEVDYYYANDFYFDASQSKDATTGKQLSDKDKILGYNGGFYGASYRVSGIPPDANITVYGMTNNFRDTSIMMTDTNMNGCITDDASGTIGVLHNRTVHSLLWGYTDPLWVLLNASIFIGDYKFYIPTIARLQFNHTNRVPTHIGEHGQRCPMWNNISECETTMTAYSSQNTGNDDLSNIGKLTKWSGKSTLDWWGAGCQSLRDATDGTQFKPGLSSSDRPWVFVDAMYRPLELAYEQDTSYQGIDGLRFGLSKEGLLNKTANAQNGCYDQDVDGLFNLTRALFAPLIVSKPYYLDANMTGRLNLTINNKSFLPNRSRDDSFIDIEPITGAPLRLSVKVQMNMMVGEQPTYYPGIPMGDSPVPTIYTQTLGMTNTTFPFFIAEDSMELSNKLVQQLKDTVFLVLTIGKYGGIGVAVLGFLMAVVGVVFMYCRKQEKENDYVSMNVSYEKRYGKLAEGL